MNRVTILSIAFLVFAVATSGWLLSRPRDVAKDDATDKDLAGVTSRAGLTFAMWSSRSDGILLADIEPGHGMSPVPRRFQVERVKVDDKGAAKVTDGASFSWGPESRAASASALHDLGFHVNAEGLPYLPDGDPLWSAPLHTAEGGADETVTLKSKEGASATFVRHRDDPSAQANWGRRAIGFLSSDGHSAYITPDAVVVRASR